MRAGLDEFTTVAGSDGSWPLELGDDARAVLDLGAGSSPTAAVGPGGGLPPSFAPAAAPASPFDEAAPVVLLTWPGSATVGLGPGHYDVWLTNAGATDRVGRLAVEQGPAASGAVPLIDAGTATRLTAGALAALDRDADDVANALLAATEDLVGAVARRHVAGRLGRRDADAEATTRAALAGADATAALAGSAEARRFVAWRACWYLAMVPTGKEGADAARRLREGLADAAGKALGALAVTVPGLGGVIMGGPGPRRER